MTTTARFKICPICTHELSNCHLSDYDPGVSYDSFRGWHCRNCRSEFPSEIMDSLESFIPKRDEQAYQAMINNIPKLTEMKPESNTASNIKSNFRSNMESSIENDIESNMENDMEDNINHEDEDTPCSLHDSLVATFATARNCPFCKSKLLTSFHINPEETFTRNFEGWFCLECTCTFSPKVSHLLEIRPDDSARLYGYTEGEIADDSLIVDPESIIDQMDSLATQVKRERGLDESEILNNPEEQYAEYNGRSIRRIRSLDELV